MIDIPDFIPSALPQDVANQLKLLRNGIGATPDSIRYSHRVLAYFIRRCNRAEAIMERIGKLDTKGFWATLKADAQQWIEEGQVPHGT